MKTFVIGFLALVICSGIGFAMRSIVDDSLAKEAVASGEVTRRMGIDNIVPSPAGVVIEGKCMKETMTVTVSMNYRSKSVESVVKRLESMDKQVRDLAKQYNIESISLQNQNYNLYTQSDSGEIGFQVNASSSYNVSSKGKPLEFYKALADKKLNPGLNMSRYIADGSVVCVQ